MSDQGGYLLVAGRLMCGVCVSEFTTEWWVWLILTGIFMACAWGSKVNGILTVVCIGCAVLVDLWDILDHRNGTTMVGYFTSVRHVGLADTVL